MARGLKKYRPLLKKTFHDPERQAPDWPDKVHSYIDELAAITPENRIFIDETGSAMNLDILYGRHLKENVAAHKPVNHGKRVNTIGAISNSGLLTSLCIEGTFNGYMFCWFVEHFLVPHLSPGKVVIMDNAKIHMDDEALYLIEQTGARVLFLPPYAPEFNPVEYCWSVLKTHLRKVKARTIQALYQALEQGIRLITQELTKACCKHCEVPSLN